MKKVPDATANNTAAGNGWFKISESGFDKHAGKWCTEKIADNNGHLSVKIPQDIRGGYYLVRSELLSLHDAAGKKPNPEFFVGCAQVFVNGSGSAKKPSTVHIGEGTYNLSIPGLTFDVNKAMTLPYPMFGPPVYKSGSGGSAQSGSAGVSASGDQTETGTAKATGTVPGLKTLSETSAVQTGTAKPANAVDGSDSESSDADSSDDEGGLLSDWDISSDSDDEDEDSDDEDETQTLGLKPKGCVLVRDNWCGIEVPSYSDEKGCWAVSTLPSLVVDPSNKCNSHPRTAGNKATYALRPPLQQAPPTAVSGRRSAVTSMILA